MRPGNEIVVQFDATSSPSSPPGFDPENPNFQDIEDIITDANSPPLSFKLDDHSETGSCIPDSVHFGFYLAYQSVEVELEEFLRSQIEKIFDVPHPDPAPTIYFAGHSLGGAVALIGALDLSGLLTDLGYQRHNIVVRTMGAPRAFRHLFLDEYTQRVPNTWQVAIRQDPIPHLSPSFFYTHTENMKVLTADWEVVLEGPDDEDWVRIENQYGPNYRDCLSGGLNDPRHHGIYESRLTRTMDPGEVHKVGLAPWGLGIIKLGPFSFSIIGVQFHWELDSGENHMITGKCDRVQLLKDGIPVAEARPAINTTGFRLTRLRYFSGRYSVRYLDGAGNVLRRKLVPQNGIPVASAGRDQIVECTGTGTLVQLHGSESLDPDSDALTYSWSAPLAEGDSAVTGVTPEVAFPFGKHTVVLGVDDGRATDVDSVLITVEDTTPPEVNLDFLTEEIWPPNNQMVLVASSVSASDLCDESPTLAFEMTSDESEQASGPAQSEPDWEVADNGDGTFDLYLRAQRGQTGSDRLYTIVATATDASQNETVVTENVVVPHDRRPGDK